MGAETDRWRKGQSVFFYVVRESWRSNDDDEDGDDDEKGSKREGDKIPARVRNHGIDGPLPMSASPVCGVCMERSVG